MATARTKSDALGYYHSDPAGLGGIRADLELRTMDPIISNPIGPIIVQHVTSKSGQGIGTIRAASTSTLAYTAPGDTEGTAVSVPANTAVLLESGTAGKAVRVYRDSVYNADSLGGSMTLDLVRQYNNVIAGDNATESASNWYGCMYIANHSDASITSVTVAPAELGTQRTSDSAQLSGSGSGTITTTGSLSDWPLYGWCHVRTSGGTTKELVYYTSRTSTSLTVPSAGRGLLGTSATAGAGTDTITPVAPIRIWVETPTAGAVQTIADHSTAPSGASWVFTTAVGTLAPGEERAVWIHRHVPAAATVNLDQYSALYTAWTYSAVAYEQTLYGRFCIGNTALERYELHVGDGTQPTFSSATTTSATLPFTSALAADSTYYYATRYRNRYNLTSFNVLTNRRDIDAGGVDVTNVLTDPSDITMTSQPGGEMDITLTYRGSTDATMADTWRLYITTDGTTPDPVTDDPSDTSMSAGGFGLNDITQTIELGPYDYGTVVKVIARVYSTTLLDESNSTTVSTATVTTQEPVQAHWLGVTTGGYRGHAHSPYEKTTYYNSPTNTVGIEIRNGEMILFGSAEAFRGVLGNGHEFRTTLDFYNVDHSASGSASPIEVIDDDTFYINVAGTRRAKIDLSAGRIEAAGFNFSDTAIDLPVIGPIYTTATATYLMILHGITGRWTPIVKVDSDGVFTTTAEVLQEQ